ncbi:MAG: CAP domain-containing protein [Candidatus Saccharibacteria bacterium]|nr:CAP domain-containing protein [Candidatus Saccharibacteria bacterium]
MWELTNEARRKAGLPPMALDPRLNASAQEKANDMAVRDYYGHESPEGVKGAALVFKHMPGKCQYASENLTTLLVPISYSRKAIDGWMSSTKGHREAILDTRYDSVGFGVAKDKHGNSHVVQHFCQPK